MQAEKWASTPAVQRMLADMLAEPSADFHERVRAALGGGELCAAHAIGLVRIASSAKDKLGKGRWESAVATSWQHAYHIWLYHFMGGAEAKLQPPSAASEAGRQLAFEIRRDAAIEAEKKFRAEADSSHNHTRPVGTFLIAVSIAERLLVAGHTFGDFSLICSLF